MTLGNGGRLTIAQEAKLDEVLAYVKEIMSTLISIQEKVAAQTSVVASAVELIAGLSARLKEIGPGDAAALADLAAQLDANSKALADAVATNTIAKAEAPVVEPVVEAPEAPAVEAPVEAPAEPSAVSVETN